MQHDRPTPQELAEAVREFLQAEILPILDDHRLKFRTLVAINGLGIAERELWATTFPREEPKYQPIKSAKPNRCRKRDHRLDQKKRS